MRGEGSLGARGMLRAVAITLYIRSHHQCCGLHAFIPLIGPAHLNPQCTSNRKQQEDAPQPECHTCKGKGHLARICPTTIRSLSVQLNRMSADSALGLLMEVFLLHRYRHRSTWFLFIDDAGLAFGPNSRGRGVSLRSMERAVHALEQQRAMQHMQPYVVWWVVMLREGNGGGCTLVVLQVRFCRLSGPTHKLTAI